MSVFPSVLLGGPADVTCVFECFMALTKSRFLLPYGVVSRCSYLTSDSSPSVHVVRSSMFRNIWLIIEASRSTEMVKRMLRGSRINIERGNVSHSGP